MDYKEYKEGKYPEPDDRKRPKDFPPVDDLFTYGIDIPVPQNVGELRCQYNDDEKDTLVLADLDGYKVPPLGILTVGVHGSGHARGFIYPPGTFRKNIRTIGLALGADQNQLAVGRAEKKISKIVSGVQRSLEKHDYQIKLGGSSADIDTLDVLAEIVTDKIIAEDSAREARQWFGDLNKIVDNQHSIIDDRTSLKREMEGKSPADLDAILEYTKQVLAVGADLAKQNQPTVEVVQVDGELVDVEPSSLPEGSL